ncbi:MAG: hypothetical protein Q7S60_04535 [bacterium]|nr:hypothetical protein [bacterium]
MLRFFSPQRGSNPFLQAEAVMAAHNPDPTPASADFEAWEIG